MDYSTFVPFFIGLASMLHCVGMCGGIIGALTMSLPAEVRQQPLRLSSFVAAYNLGRISSYALGGLVVGALSQGSALLIDPERGHLLLNTFASLLLIGTGLYIAGWFPRFARLEQVGRPLWARLEPWGRRLLPVRTPGRAFLFGMVWGWLPCGLVYTTLLWVLSASSPAEAALEMALFGAGTLPGVMTAGMLAGWLIRVRQARWVRPALGLLLIAVALTSLYLNTAGLGSGHHH